MPNTQEPIRGLVDLEEQVAWTIRTLKKIKEQRGYRRVKVVIGPIHYWHNLGRVWENLAHCVSSGVGGHPVPSTSTAGDVAEAIREYAQKHPGTRVFVDIFWPPNDSPFHMPEEHYDIIDVLL